MDTAHQTEIVLSIEEDIAIVTLRSHNGENRITPEFFPRYHSVLDQIEKDESIRVMITTAKGKCFSNGLDVNRAATLTPAENRTLLMNLCELIGRILVLPLPTIAALNGHAFAGGAFLALAHDYRLMNSDRGWISIPELHMRMRIPAHLIEMTRAKLSGNNALNAAVGYGIRYGAQAAKTVGYIQEKCPGPELLKQSKIRAALLVPTALHRPTVAQLKSDLYRPVQRLLVDYDAAVGATADYARDVFTQSNL